jgi:hypothetical protein
MATIQLLILLNFIQVWFQRPKIFKCVMKCILTTANTSIMLLYQTKRNFSKRRFLSNRWKNNNKKKQAVISWNQSMLITEKLKKMHQQTSKIYSMKITVNFSTPKPAYKRVRLHWIGRFDSRFRAGSAPDLVPAVSGNYEAKQKNVDWCGPGGPGPVTRVGSQRMLV